ncbi:hypothetical protein TVAG_215270 [Trichomonas vaginalis G3]|uniref:Uncharacterized protein n=1 Tax=Trichomonas vaginalis (strain ATCC PRA-98 / G3) TaxID=412133 RepID=A2F657_TRIV3|nr:hypothetical protein TVAGG3_0364000 [Trichomonas vaginalis G3]EAX99627.1 hypothetical protein TVAG_215270 [Trichomonas vaginalis G3]KAI5532142.1 hypothetical protein TVAGG3_0364000 [Trichomonas vaginalis G3]|eukprot:XP_001312557.1 hypothetical protein [Trichomonas vaginalis G3]
MLSFFIFSFAKSEDFCIKARDYEGACSEGKTVISDITTFYKSFETTKGNTLEVLNTPNSVITIDFSKFHDCTLMISGRDSSKIAIINPIDIQHSHITLQYMTIRFDDTRFVPVFIHELSLVNITFENAETIELSTEHLNSDAYSIQFFKNMSCDQLGLQIGDISMLPKRDAYISINGVKPSRIYHFSSDVNVSVSTPELNITFPSATYHFYPDNISKVQIIHDTDINMYVTSPQNAVVQKDKYTFTVNNANLIADYSRFNEGPTVTTTGQSTVTVKQNAIFLTVNSGTTILKGIKGTTQGSTFSINNGAILQLSDCATPYEAFYVSITGTGQITTDGNVVLQQNGIFEVSSTTSPSQIGENITLYVTNPRQMHFTDSEFTIDTIKFDDDAKFFINFVPNIHGGVTIKNGLDNFKTSFKYTYGQLPSNEESEQLMKNNYYGICSPTINCDEITYELIDGGLHGFNNDDSLVKFVCEKVEENYCTGVTLTQRPLDVYPQYCRYDDGSSYNCNQPYLDITDDNISNLANFVPKTAKLITIQAEANFTKYANFTGLNLPNITLTGSQTASIDFTGVDFGNIIIDSVSTKLNGTDSTAISLLVTDNAINFEGFTDLDSESVELTLPSMRHFFTWVSNVTIPDNTHITFGNLSHKIINGVEYNPQLVNFKLPPFSTCSVYLSLGKNVNHFTSILIYDHPRYVFLDGWENKEPFYIFRNENELHFTTSSYAPIKIGSDWLKKSISVDSNTKEGKVTFPKQGISGTDITFTDGNASEIILSNIDFYSANITSKNQQVTIDSGKFYGDNYLNNVFIKSCKLSYSSKLDLNGNASIINIYIGLDHYYNNSKSVYLNLSNSSSADLLNISQDHES